MQKINVDRGVIMVSGKPVSLISGEMHYWRNSPDNWSAILDAIEQLGLKTIATYVPWQHHNVGEDELDFTGATRPSRNLVGFLELVNSKGFQLLIRPGPYIYAEWLNAGVPDQVIIYNKIHPEFKKAARDYVYAVSKILIPFQANRGGPIIALQADNNIECWEEIYEKQLGIAGGEGLFQEFLAEKYGDVDRLNETWGTDYSCFNEAQAFTSIYRQTPEYKRRYLDTFRFRFWYTNRYAEWIKNVYQEAGIDIPIYFNGFNSFNQEQNLADLASIGAFSGVNCYPSNEFRHSSKEHQEMLQSLRYIKVYSPIPYIAELQAGTWHGWHYSHGIPSPNHYRLGVLSAILAGVTSWNWFMIAGRDNFYGCPINEWGHKAGELYDTFKQLIQIAQSLNLPRLTPLISCSVTINLLHPVARELGYDESVLDALYESGIAYDFFDPGLGRIVRPLIFYSGSSWLSEKEQLSLLDYIKSGGNLIIFQTSPQEDDHFNPLNLLGIKEPSRISSKVFVDHFGTDMECLLGNNRVTVEMPSPLYQYPTTYGTPILATRLPTKVYQDSSGEWSWKMTDLACQGSWCIGYIEKIGKGKLAILGLKPNPSLIIALHRYFEIPIYARSLTPLVQAALFQSTDGLVLIAVNNGNEAKSASIQIDDNEIEPGNYRLDNLMNSTSSTKLLGFSEHIIVDLPSKDGTIIRLQKK